MMSSRAQFSICAGVLTLYIAKQCFGIFARFQSVECEKKHLLVEVTSMFSFSI